jgi:hypothetical protein
MLELDGGWLKKKALIVVKTYPTPSSKGIEVSCTAAIDEQGKWMRIFPVPFRYLDDEKRFRKYQWIEANFKPAKGDVRPESQNVNLDSIKILEEFVPTDDNWRKRKEILRPLVRPSLEAIAAERDKSQFPTLGIFKPKRIKRLIIEPDDEGPDWSAAQLAKLQQDEAQMTLFDKKAPLTKLEKIPYVFKYEFECDDSDCHGHTTSCTDWEMLGTYRSWRSKYGAKDWEAKFRLRFEKEMIEKYETHFYVGTVHIHPDRWIIVGLFYPRIQPEALTLGL